MSVFYIKIIAMALMVVDHVGAIFFPDILIFRIIGRLSFPLFAWLIANGAFHTKDIVLYIKRLFIFAFISQIPYWLAFSSLGIDRNLNIFFTLALGALSLYLLQKFNKKYVQVGSILILSFLASLLMVDYGSAGVLSIVMFYLFFHNKRKMFLSQLLIFSCFYTLPLIETFGLSDAYANNAVGLVQPLAVLSTFIIWKYNGEEGIKAKYLFYLFYPLHLLILFLITLI